MSLVTMVATKRTINNSSGSSVSSMASSATGQAVTMQNSGRNFIASTQMATGLARPMRIEPKYVEGERVLCYEPDPKKVRVVYDAKILQVAEDLDSRGKLRGHQYKVHFQGWNSSWDRYVGEDFLLKDNLENREHQKQLTQEAEEARLLMRKKKKKKSKKSHSSNDETAGDASMTSGSDQPENASQSTSPKKKKKKKRSRSNSQDGDQLKIGKLLIVNGSITSPSSSVAAATNLSPPAKTSPKPLSPLPVLKIKSPKAVGVTPTIKVESGAGILEPVSVPAVGNTISRRRKRNLSADGTPLQSIEKNGGLTLPSNKSVIKKRAKLVQQRLEEDLTSASPVPPQVASTSARLSTSNSQLVNLDATFSRKTPTGYPNIILPENLRKKLNEDYEFVCKKRRLTVLPAVPSIVSVLEDFVRHYSAGRLVAFEKQQRKSVYTGYKRGENAEITYQRALETIQMCKEVAEGLRILIDFNLKKSLLYQPETEQFEASMTNEAILSRISQPDAPCFKPESGFDVEVAVNGTSQIPEEALSLKTSAAAVVMKTKRNDIYSSSHPEIVEVNPTSGLKRRHHTSSGQPLSSRRTSCETSCLGAPSTTLSSALSNKEGSSCSTNSRSTNRTSLLMPPAASSPSTPAANKVMRSIESWNLVPNSVYEQRPPLPSILFGPIHLLRLFVKLPEILGRMQLPPKTSKLLIKYMDAVLEYLDSRPDLFAPEVYES